MAADAELIEGGFDVFGEAGLPDLGRRECECDSGESEKSDGNVFHIPELWHTVCRI